MSQRIEHFRATGPRRTAAALCILLLYAGAAYSARPVVGEPAPDFALKSSTGHNLRLSEYRGDVVFVNFWTRSCGHCREQLAGLEELYRTYRDSGVTILSVAIVRSPDDAQEVVRNLGLSYPLLYDDERRVARLYDPATIPFAVLIDPHGVVRAVYRKYRNGDVDTYRAKVAELLAE